MNSKINVITCCVTIVGMDGKVGYKLWCDKHMLEESPIVCSHQKSFQDALGMPVKNCPHECKEYKKSLVRQ